MSIKKIEPWFIQRGMILRNLTIGKINTIFPSSYATLKN